jgi:5-methylcytosine-specific restriction endonuclease McrA
MPRHRTTFHGTAVWKRARRIAKIEAKHTCARCHAFLPGKGELHVHHKKPVTKAMALALEPLNFQVLCPECHNIVEPRSGTPRIKSGCDEQGRPTDPSHPWFQR